MGGLTSTIGSIVGGVGDITGSVLSGGASLASKEFDNFQRRRELRAQQDTALKQLQEKQTEDLERAAEKAIFDREKILADTDQRERDRRSSLKRAVARQRARAGTSGITASNGSGEAILLGLFDESEDERSERQRQDDLRLRAIDSDITNRQSRNLLEASQLREHQRLERSLLR